MDTIRSLRCFVRAVELGSLSAVAREERTTQPTVSKLMAALERELGVRLLERSTTSLQPTPQGSRFYQRALGVLAEYQEAVAEARGQTDTPAGLIRVNAPAAFGQFRLNAMLASFLEQYPQVDIELILDDRMVDLVKEGSTSRRYQPLRARLLLDHLATHIARMPGYANPRPATRNP